MKKLLILAAVMLAGCTSANDATRTLEGSGYSNVDIGGYSFFGCGKGDTFHTEFTATNPAGKRVSGVVCSGWLKDGTIRF